MELDLMKNDRSELLTCAKIEPSKRRFLDGEGGEKKETKITKRKYLTVVCVNERMNEMYFSFA